MTREEILKGIERLRPWFHCIELGDGIKTKTESVSGEPIEHPQGMWQIIKRCLPEELSGKTVLDVGCNAGFYAVQSKKRCAARVLGVDAQRHHVRQANFVSRVLGLEIEFERMSVYDLNPHSIGQFDITLALGLIYHCKHLVLALEKLFQVTKQLLIIETAIYPLELTPESFHHPIGGSNATLHPLAYVANPVSAKEAVFNWFIPSIEALRALLINIGFDEVTLFDTVGERAVFICQKHQAYPDSHALSQLAAGITLKDAPVKCRAASHLEFRVQVQNTGFARWLATGEPETQRAAVRLTVGLQRESNEESFPYYAGAFLPHDIAPGETVNLALRFQAPEIPGKYWLHFDMVSEHLVYFEDVGSPVINHALLVE